MKNVVLLIALCFFTGTMLNAQQAKSSKKMECCVMKKGKMVCIKNGKEMPMKEEMKMNGMTVMPDGTCKMNNGTTMKLKEGQCCDKTGKIHSDCMK